MEQHGAPLILVVDDDPRNTRLVQAQLSSDGYRIQVARSGEEALQQLAATLPDLILLDVMMPGMSGYEVAARIKGQERTRNIPIIIVTALDDRGSRLHALEVGAEEFLHKPIDRAELSARVRNLLRLKDYQDFLSRHNEILERQVQERTKQLADAYRDTIYTLVRAAEYKDEGTGAHVQRISFYCLEMAERLGLDRDFRDKVFYASPMHDIGKIGIPDAVLLKPGGYTPDEWTVMKSHCGLGAQILQQGSSPYSAMGVEIALNHHERWDGSGYPNGRKGEAIPLSARIVNVCDQYDALRSKRPYKPALSHDDTVRMIRSGDGRTRPEHFDPQLLDVFLGINERFRDIYEAHSE